MARIRSVHPELFTDEGFCSLSPLARLLYIGIWTQCDDQGVFEWKPFGMKITLMPVDTVDVGSLLGELVENKQVFKYEVDGRTFGAVRNFCRFQKPKKHVDRYPILPSVPSYVALDQRKTPQGAPKGTSEGEKFEHRSGEEGRGEKGDNSKTKTESLERVPPAVSEAPPAAATLSPKPASLAKGDYTAIHATEMRKAARGVFGTLLPSDWIPDDPTCARVKTDFGMTDEDLRTELPAFHALNVQGGVLSADWTATFYLFCKRWKEHRDKQAAPRLELNRKAAEPAKQPEQFTEADWDSVVGMYARTGRWSRQAGNDPTSPACLAPRAILEKHGINLETGERTIPPRKAAAS